MKVCSRCRLPKTLDEFSRWRGSPDGRWRRCRDCDSAHQRDYYRRRCDGLPPHRDDDSPASAAIGRIRTITADEHARMTRLVPAEHIMLLMHRPGAMLRCLACRGRVVVAEAEQGRLEFACMLCARVLLTVEGPKDRVARLRLERVRSAQDVAPKRGRPRKMA